MRTLCYVMSFFLLFAIVSYAADFSPTPMVLTVHVDTIKRKYSVNGGEIILNELIKGNRSDISRNIFNRYG